MLYRFVLRMKCTPAPAMPETAVWKASLVWDGKAFRTLRQYKHGERTPRVAEDSLETENSLEADYR